MDIVIEAAVEAAGELLSAAIDAVVDKAVKHKSEYKSEYRRKHTMAIKSLIINPGSTSTKIGVFEDENLLFEETLRHSTERSPNTILFSNRRISVRRSLPICWQRRTAI